MAPHHFGFAAGCGRACPAGAGSGMTRAGRLTGYALMAAAAALAVAQRRGAIDSVGPLPVAAVALLLGMIGVMLVFTDLMVRGLYAQIGTAKPPGDTVADDHEKRLH